jgi:hypothetical protein
MATGGCLTEDLCTFVVCDGIITPEGACACMPGLRIVKNLPFW